MRSSHPLRSFLPRAAHTQFNCFNFRKGSFFRRDYCLLPCVRFPSRSLHNSASMTSKKGLLAVVQMTSTADLEKNFNTAYRFIKEAADRKASLVALPENFLFLGSSFPVSLAEPIPGPSVQKFQEIARDLSISILMGSILEKIPDDPEHIYNTSVLIDHKGDIAAKYRKIHLFDVLLPHVQLLESKTVRSGDELVVVDHPLGKLGLTICYDLRFPVQYQKLTQLGAQIIFVPSAFTLHTGMAHWIPLLQARGIENQIGKHNEKRHSYGSSVIIDPWGTIVARAPETECVIYADIDLDYLHQVRANMPVHTHRRAVDM